MSERLRFLRSRSGAIGFGIVVFVVLVAVFGPFFAPHDPRAPIGLPLTGSSGHAPLGTDFLGRDVLSRLLYGGRSVIGFAAAATILAYVVGMSIGRVGCFLTGLDDHTCGTRTGLPWAVDFGDGPRHPTQLYEIAFLLLMYLTCRAFVARDDATGACRSSSTTSWPGVSLHDTLEG